MAEKSNPNLLFANFNQDFSCISVGTKKGYSIMNCDPFGRVYSMTDGPRSIVEMLFCTSLIALVGDASPSSSSLHPSSHSSPSSKSPQPSTSPSSSHPTSSHSPNSASSSSRRHLQIVNTKRQSTICELLFPSSILAVKMNRKTLVIVLSSEIYVYDISNMRLLHVIETNPNPEGVCALSPDVERSYLAYPAPVPSSSSSSSSHSSSHPTSGLNAHQGTGDVLLFSTRTLTVANAIQAHKSALSHLALNQSGTLLATASEKGTVIRVWSVPGAEKLYQFRRGAREARIYCVCFDTVGRLLAVSSAHGTVHIFKLGGRDKSPSPSSSSSTKGTTIESAKGYTVDPMKAYTVDPMKGSPRSPPESLDGRESTQLEGGYEVFAERRGGVGSSLTRRSLHLGKSLTHSVGSYLPSSMKEMWDPQRDFASLTLPSGGVRTVVGLSSTMPHVMVISSEGYLYLYSIDLENGGECGLVKQYSLLDSVDVDPTGEVPDAAPGKS